MKDDMLKGGIAVVPMRSPAVVVQIYFHVAGDGFVVTEANDRAAKIWSAFDAAKTRMKHANGLTVQGLNSVAVQPLMLPDGLKEFFRRRFSTVVQFRDNAAL